jgi:hypothetical protein
MTEAGWVACTDPKPMLEFLRGKASRRKVALWITGCYRASLPRGHRFLKAVEVVERYGEGTASDAELEEMHQRYHTHLVLIRDPADPCDFALLASGACTRGLHHLPAILLRDIFGNPFRPPSPLPQGVLAWNGSTVRRLAEGIYEERAFERLPILADALLDAGCEQEGLIEHCRSEWPHLRGCWVVDLILGKS